MCICVCLYLYSYVLSPLPSVLDKTPSELKLQELEGYTWLPHSTSSLTLWGTLQPTLWVFCLTWLYVSFLLTLRELPICTLSMGVHACQGDLSPGSSQCQRVMDPSWPGSGTVFIPVPPQDQQVVGPLLSSRTLYSQVPHGNTTHVF